MIGSEDEFHVFARVTNIYASQGKVVFFVLVLCTNSYDNHFHSYELYNRTSTKYIDYNQLFSYDPLHERFILGQLFISLKYELIRFYIIYIGINLHWY